MLSVVKILLVCIALISCNNTPEGLPEEFEEVDHNNYDKNMINFVEWSDNSFYVVNQNEQLIVFEDTVIKTTPILFLNDGKLEGVYTGECWEGCLKFTSNNYPDSATVIKDGIIKFIFSYLNENYIITYGHTDDRLHVGTLEKIERKNEEFLFNEIHRFTGVPLVYSVYNEKLIILTSKKLIVFDNGKKKELFKDDIWNSNRPNSICVLDERNVYLGMDYVIVRLDLIDEKMYFYQKRK